MNAATFARWGFDGPRFVYGLRTAIAACIALFIAWGMGLEHPQWAAMTVWAGSQPIRGMLIEKSLFRAAGTAVGVVAGVLLMLLARGDAVILVVGLALWVGLCAAAGNVVRGFVSYGTILAGFSAAMVTLLSTAHHDSIVLLATDRFATVLVGVVVALIVGLVFTPAASGDYESAATKLTARLLDEMARPAEERSLKEQKAILSEAATIEEALDPRAAGSINGRRLAHAVRALLLALVSGLLWLRGSEAARTDAETRQLLAEGGQVDAARFPEGARALRSISLGVDGLDNRPLEERDVHASVLLHRDWDGARTAGIRATATMLVIGLVWVVTGWEAVPYVLLGTSVMVTVFSTFDDPANFLKAVFTGQVLGAIAALGCRWLLWPHADNELAMLLMMVPFILSGSLVQSHKLSVPAAMDYAMVFLLLSQPVLPLSGTFLQSVFNAAAVISGPLIAMAAFRLIYPIHPRRRLQLLVAAMVHELEHMAKGEGAAGGERWRMRLNHRLLRLVRWVEKTGSKDVDAFEGSFAVLALGSAIARLRELQAGGDLSQSTARAMRAALLRCADVGEEPEAAARAMEQLAKRLPASSDTELLVDAARQVRAESAFFRLGAA
ncbi:hypothetical protein JP74_09305 [Devosia sp. 17-2-E-8]|nr:hypothetical protein JP74_09305 [Devosia sp. 17-2-E-8]